MLPREGVSNAVRRVNLSKGADSKIVGNTEVKTCSDLPVLVCRNPLWQHKVIPILENQRSDLFRVEQRNAVLIRLARQGRTAVFRDRDLAEIQNATSVLKMTTKRWFVLRG